MLTRRAVVLGGLSAAAVAPIGCGGGWRSKARAALERGSEALWKLQSDDGAFRSAKYGLLRDGWSLTPFALLALIRTGRELPSGRASRALGWIAHGTKNGVLGLESAAPDYPCYATAMALHCLTELRPPDSEGLVDELRKGLLAFQLTESDGWKDHPGCGAFRMGSRDVPRPPHSGHVDLSMTRRAVEALVASGLPADNPAIREAVGFAERCRTPEGAFVYTATETALNKGRRDGSDPGYGTATADGVLLRLAAGEAVDRGKQALSAMHRADENPRVGEGPFRPYARAMRGYYRAAAGRVFARVGGPQNWEQALASAVIDEQQSDGTWANTRTEQKEDEPIVATGFALEALSAALHR